MDEHEQSGETGSEGPEEQKASAGGEEERRNGERGDGPERSVGSSRRTLAKAGERGVDDGSLDVQLDVPMLKVDEIDIEVQTLDARVALNAELAGMLRLNVGADVHVGDVDITLKGVDAQALLQARLDTVERIIARTLDSIDAHPEILESLTGGAGKGLEHGASRAAKALGLGRAGSNGASPNPTRWLSSTGKRLMDRVRRGATDIAHKLDEKAGGKASGAKEALSRLVGGDGTSVIGEQVADRSSGLRDEARPRARETPRMAPAENGGPPSAAKEEPPMEMLLSEHATDEGRITRRVLDAFGDILEVAFQDGEVLDERLIGSLDELRVLKEERRDDMLVRRLRDDSGRIIRQVVDQVGRIVHLSVEEDGDSAESDERNGATSAARELAAREGIDLSIVGGTGPDGRVLARDVGEAVRRRSNGRFRESPERS